jgi:hypothetical protein
MHYYLSDRKQMTSHLIIFHLFTRQYFMKGTNNDITHCVMFFLPWRIPSSGTLQVVLVRTDVSEEYIASIIRVRRIYKLVTTSVLTSNWSTFLRGLLRLLVVSNVVPSSPILVILVMEVVVPLKHWFLQEPHGVSPQKMTLFIVTAIKISNHI